MLYRRARIRACPDRVHIILIAAAILLASAALALAMPPTTQASTQIQLAFNNLASTDPAVREQARTDLLGLHRPELAILQQIVRQNQPLLPSQSVALHDIVVHDYLVDEPYEKSPGIGVMGVHPDSVSSVNVGDHNVTGILINDCLPGFVGYRFLRPGDLIVGLSSDDSPPADFNADHFTKIVQLIGAGHPITLQLVRRGKLMRVKFLLDAAPAVLLAGVPTDPEKVAKDQAFLLARTDAAQRYWTLNFQSLLAAAD